MTQIRTSITIDQEVKEETKKKAKEEGRSFSGMLQWMAKVYLKG